MLSACERAEMAACVEETFDQTAAIVRDVLEETDQGGQTATPATVARVRCRLLPDNAPGEDLEAGRPASVTFWRVTVPLGTDLRAADRLTIGGRTYQVDSVDTGRSFAASGAARCRRVE